MQNAIEKRCTRCGLTSPLPSFYKDKRASDGCASNCKKCHNKITQAYGANHKEVARASSARYRAKNPGAGKETNLKWRKENGERLAAIQSKYAKRHPEKIRALVHISSAKRKARKLLAMPHWADEVAILEIYTAARSATKKTGITHHVDHIVPLISDFVCGLHVPANLRVLEATINLSKSNRHWPDMA